MHTTIGILKIPQFSFGERAETVKSAVCGVHGGSILAKFSKVQVH